ncbi:MAG TPA: hypothetical protein VIJ92_05730 [Ginsengibacter sp.]
MKLRTLFGIIIKVFGFFIIKDILATLPYLITPIMSLAGSEEKFDSGTLIVTLLILALYFAIAYALIFKTESMLNLLKLEPELSDEYLTFDVSAVNILTIALIILAGYLLIEEIPDFCNYLFSYYEQSQLRFQATKPPISKLMISGIKIVIAFLIIGERKKIIQLIQKDEPAHEEEPAQEEA